LRSIGPYTASAVLAIVYGQVESLLDVNMARLLGRFVGLPAGTGRGRNRSLHELARLVVDGEDCLPVNLAVLDCGALVCKAPALSRLPPAVQVRVFRPQRHSTPTVNALSS
jgi:A/G-specific adenine glycosylase